MIAGVASGLADYMQVEVTIIRIIVCIIGYFYGWRWLIGLYNMWIIVPVNNDPASRFSNLTITLTKTTQTPHRLEPLIHLPLQMQTGISQLMKVATKKPFGNATRF
ncbi:PspC domain-containing protein [Pedobacter fastidiosus]|uniref:PspC domain-containing protein n=1 Tax=Pedobacter fastidiosus TaxID=2765361 RepID=UPI0036113873